MHHLGALPKELLAEEIGRINEHPIYRVSGGRGPRVLLVAGIHGNEPAGVIALCTFLQGPILKYLDTYEFTVIPWINPTGIEQGTRRNHLGIDLNRHFGLPSAPEELRIVQRHIHGKYSFCMDLHEDPTDEPAQGYESESPPREFYLYEITPQRSASAGRILLERVERAGFPLCNRPHVYGEECRNGLLWSDGKDGRLRGQFYQYVQRYTQHSFTTETPTCWPLERRVRAQLTAIEAALEACRQGTE